MTLKRWLVRAGSALLVLAGVVASAAPLRVLDELVQVRTNGWTNVVPTNATAEGVFEWLESNVVSKTYLGDFTDDAITNYDNGIKVWILGQDQALWTNVQAATNQLYTNLVAETNALIGEFRAYTNAARTNLASAADLMWWPYVTRTLMSGWWWGERQMTYTNSPNVYSNTPSTTNSMMRYLMFPLSPVAGGSTYPSNAFADRSAALSAPETGVITSLVARIVTNDDTVLFMPALNGSYLVNLGLMCWSSITQQNGVLPVNVSPIWADNVRYVWWTDAWDTNKSVDNLESGYTNLITGFNVTTSAVGVRSSSDDRPGIYVTASLFNSLDEATNGVGASTDPFYYREQHRALFSGASGPYQTEGGAGVTYPSFTGSTVLTVTNAPDQAIGFMIRFRNELSVVSVNVDILYIGTDAEQMRNVALP